MIELVLNVSTKAFKATKSDASTLVSFVVNVISSPATTFPIAPNVVLTAPVVIVAVTTPLVAPAILFTSVALIAPPVISVVSLPSNNPSALLTTVPIFAVLNTSVKPVIEL